MSLLTTLKALGKDLEDVGKWIDDGLKIAAPVVTAVDAPLGAILTEVENIIAGIEGSAMLTASQVQAIVTAVTAYLALKTPATPTPAASS